ncbi:MAG: hypothetical protein IJN29_04030 [Akkermansia sp.]|nr:hypothetical protein [Akkermansia sp.]
MNSWDKYKAINASLEKDFLCIPPYYSVTRPFIDESYDDLIKNGSCAGRIMGLITSPFQRAYQLEYRYKQCEIFEDFIPAIEHSLYDFAAGNWVCAYLSFLPIVESVIRKFTHGRISEDDGIKKHATELINEYKSIMSQVYEDERKPIKEGLISHLSRILEDTLFDRFNQYYAKGHKVVFNRNLTLHKLEGVNNFVEGTTNSARLLLILDIFAELWLMRDANKYAQNTLYIEPDENLDYQIRLRLYNKLFLQTLGASDLFYIDEVLMSTKSDEEKKGLVALLEMQAASLLPKSSSEIGDWIKNCARYTAERISGIKERNK